MPVLRAREHSIGNHRNRRRLRQAPANRGRRRAPLLLTSSQIDRVQTRSAVLREPVRDGRVGKLIVRRMTPFDATQRPTLADAGLPKNMSLVVRVHSIYHTGFLPG